MLAGGGVPGHSTDNDAVLLAKQYGAKHILNISNIDYVYSKDPGKYKSAKPLKELNWDAFLEIVGSQRVPGGHYPFDPQASRYAKKNKLTVSFVNGNNFKNMNGYFRGVAFKGTIISL